MATMSPLRRRMIEDMTIRNLSRSTQQAVRYVAPDEPGLARVKVTVRQNDIMCVNEALITVTNELLAQINPATAHARGMPGYTFERAPGETWRSKFDTTRNLIVVNNGHRDFVYASRTKSLKLRYLEGAGVAQLRRSSCRPRA